MPVDSVSSRWTHVQGPDDLSEELMERVAHFFEHYKDLDEGKWVRVGGWDGPEAAKEEILNSIKMFNDAPIKPHF